MLLFMVIQLKKRKEMNKETRTFILGLIIILFSVKAMALILYRMSNTQVEYIDLFWMLICILSFQIGYVKINKTTL
jgi:hypothetical protein